MVYIYIHVPAAVARILNIVINIEKTISHDQEVFQHQSGGGGFDNQRMSKKSRSCFNIDSKS